MTDVKSGDGQEDVDTSQEANTTPSAKHGIDVFKPTRYCTIALTLLTTL